MKDLIVVGSHKGGVGKTTHVANLGCALASEEKPVLLVDLDPQQNLAESFGFYGWEGAGVEDLLLRNSEVSFDDVVQDLGGGLYLLPNRGHLADFAKFLDPIREQDEDSYLDSLQDAVDRFPHEDSIVIFDTPPGTAFVSDLSFATAQWVLVAAEAKPFEVMSAEKIYDKLTVVDDLQILGVVNTRIRQTSFKRVPKIYRRAREAVQTSGDMELFDVEIPENLEVAEAVEKGKPIVRWKPDHKASRRYQELAQAISTKIEARKAVAA